MATGVGAQEQKQAIAISETCRVRYRLGKVFFSPAAIRLQAGSVPTARWLAFPSADSLWILPCKPLRGASLPARLGLMLLFVGRSAPIGFPEPRAMITPCTRKFFPGRPPAKPRLMNSSNWEWSATAIYGSAAMPARWGDAKEPTR